MTSENIAALQDNFFMCHPHAGLLLSHTGNLSLNTAAMNLFGAYQLSPYQNILSHLLHPEDCQQLHTLLAAHLSTDHTPPTNHSYLWRWFVNHDQMSTIKSHVSYNEHGCCVVLEPASQTLANQHNPEIGNNFSEYKSLPNTLNTLDDGADVDAAALEDIIDLWKYLNKDESNNIYDKIVDREIVDNNVANYTVSPKDALEQLPDAVFCVDQQWRFSFVNPAAAQALTATDVLGQSLWNIAPNLSEHVMGSYYRAAMTSGKASYHEAIAQDAPFTGRWHGTHLRPFAKGLLVTIKDITHRKRSEEALLAQKAYSDKLLAERNAILESISDYFLILDRDWKIIYANDNIADFLDTTNTELIGQYFWDVSNIAVGHPLLESYQRAMYSGHPQHIETESSYRPGQYLDVHSYPYAGGLVIYARDISVRKILEHRLTQTLEDKEAILNSISDLMVCLDSNWCFTYANQHGQHYLPKDFLGKHYFEVYPDNQDSIFVQSYQQVLTKQQPITFEAQGSISGRWLEHRVYPYQGGIIIYATNIDERKQLEQDLQATLIQKDMLMKELHHRTTNNLQLVASMLAIQARQLTDESAKAALQNSQNRIHTLAEIHAMLYRQDASTLDTASYLKLLAENVIAANSTSAVRLECHLVPLDLPLEQTIALGLIANELITNALKHAFTDPHQNDTIGLLLEQDSSNVGGNVIFIAYNNGKPLKHDQNPSPTSNSLGMTIIQALSRQLDGHFELFNAPDDKVVARVCFTV